MTMENQKTIALDGFIGVKNRRQIDNLVNRGGKVIAVAASNPIAAIVKSGVKSEDIRSIKFLGRAKGQEYRYELDGELIVVS